MTPSFIHVEGRGHIPFAVVDQAWAVELFADQLSVGHTIEETCDFMRAWASGAVHD